MFRRKNTEAIMTLMKYSLDLSIPWVTQYYSEEKDDQDAQTFEDNRDLYKVWLANGGNEMLNIFSKDQRQRFLNANGYVTRMKYNFGVFAVLI